MLVQMDTPESTPPEEIPDDLVSVTQAAAAMGVSEQTIRRYMREGRVTKYRNLRNVFVSRRELERLRAIRAHDEGSK